MLAQYRSEILRRLSEEKDRLGTQFQSGHPGTPTRFFYLDNLLPKAWAEDIYRVFPQPAEMRLMSSFRERKYTSKDLGRFSPLLKDMTFAVQAPEVLKLVEEITGIEEQYPDEKLYAGGLSLMAHGQFLNPHVDNSHDFDRKLYRTVNLLYYVTPDWRDENGGHLELWDPKVSRPVTLHSRFNRLVVMETNRGSWHSVSPVVAAGRRCCVSNYYFSPRSPERVPYFHVTSFTARPEQKLRRLLAAGDSWLRNTARKVVSEGFAPKDLYIHKN